MQPTTDGKASKEALDLIRNHGYSDEEIQQAMIQSYANGFSTLCKMTAKDGSSEPNLDRMAMLFPLAFSAILCIAAKQVRRNRALGRLNRVRESGASDWSIKSALASADPIATRNLLKGDPSAPLDQVCKQNPDDFLRILDLLT